MRRDDIQQQTRSSSRAKGSCATVKHMCSTTCTRLSSPRIPGHLRIDSRSDCKASAHVSIVLQQRVAPHWDRNQGVGLTHSAGDGNSPVEQLVFQSRRRDRMAKRRSTAGPAPRELAATSEEVLPLTNCECCSDACTFGGANWQHLSEKNSVYKFVQ